jgi:hypothetical protein
MDVGVFPLAFVWTYFIGNLLPYNLRISLLSQLLPFYILFKRVDQHSHVIFDNRNSDVSNYLLLPPALSDW